jgi:hypothetical protein
MSESVKVRIFYIYRTRTDSIVVIIVMQEEELWRLGTMFGKLVQLLTRNIYIVWEEKFLSSDEVGKTTLSSREVVNELPLTGDQGLKNCNYLKTCFTKSTCANFWSVMQFQMSLTAHHSLIFMSLYKVFIF